MYVDAQLQFSAAQAVTSAAGSTNTIDTSVVRNLGVGQDLYIVVVNPTILADGGSNAGTVVALEGDSTTTITPDATVDLFTFAQAAPAGTVKIAKLSPSMAPLAYRYLRLKYTPTTADLTGGTFTAFITSDVAAYTSYADNIAIA